MNAKMELVQRLCGGVVSNVVKTETLSSKYHNFTVVSSSD